MTQSTERPNERRARFLIAAILTWIVAALLVLHPSVVELPGWGAFTGLRIAALGAAGVLLIWLWGRCRVAGK